MALGIDENVGRLEVGVQDATVMRERDGRCDARHQLEQGQKGKLALTAELVKRFAIDEFHDKKEIAGRTLAGVMKTNNVVVLEIAKNAALGAEPVVMFLTVKAENFDYDGLGEGVVIAVGKIDDAHAAAAEFAIDLVGAEARPGEEFGLILGGLGEDGEAEEIIGVGKTGKSVLCGGQELGGTLAGRGKC
jgi:hypothetical protein